MTTPRPNLEYRRDTIVAELERRRALPADERAAAEKARAAAAYEAFKATEPPTDDELERELEAVNAELSALASNDARTETPPPADVPRASNAPRPGSRPRFSDIDT